ncbi:2-haloacid dehalogenase [Natronocella acetinitrilica]|uniref:(S)-2-haloacid dehalogenase n=1 Tax=Natronocella acetinitrilica TaxID=414046 RepID=A0AAE3G3Z2_9GAMM|nr:haloacid dehalogenase type II [Natronocella acetinitrilica]MCP1674753.1 2-haloacid dehalogenase [Natronocella acetinitrilica]
MPDPDQFNTVKACVFDAYGTLFDVHSAVARHRHRIGAEADAVSALWRRKQLEYTWLRSLMQRHADFQTITEQALDHALSVHQLPDASLRRDLLSAYGSLDCYPEVPAVLAALREAGLRTAILSNGSPDMLAAAVDSAGLGDHLDAVLSIESVGVFKPDPRSYRLALDRLGLSARQVLFHSSNGWDVAGAATFGFHVAWINRFAAPRECLPGEPDVELQSLEPVPGLLGRG